jgi:hypothetical protein
MTTPLNYTVIPGDQNHLEYIVNSLTSHDLGQVLNTLSTPTFAGGDITGSMTVGADLDVTNDVTIGNDLDVTGSLSIDGTLELTGLSASRLVATNASKELISSDLDNWVAGTANQISVTDDADGTITLSTPQDINTGASPTFAGLTLSGLSPNGICYINDSNEIATDSGLTWDETNDCQTITGTAGKQLKLAYDVSKYNEFKTDSSGNLIITSTGFITTINTDFYPATDATYDLGGPTYQWDDFYAVSAYCTSLVVEGTLHLEAGRMTDSSGTISFDNENLTTTGLGTFGQLTTDYLNMPEIAAPSTPSTNNLRIYTEAIKGFSFLKYLDDTGMKRAFMRDSVIPVKNVRGTAIAASRLVYATGSEDNVPTVDTAKADSLTTMPAIGVTIESIANGAYGRVMQVGLLENINTSAFSEGDVLYVSDSTAGVPTATKPVTPSISQEIGTVLVSDVSVGAIQIVARGITGSEYGTIQNTFFIGDGSAGSKTLTFNSATDGSVIWDETKFDFGSTNITTTGNISGADITASGTITDGTASLVGGILSSTSIDLASNTLTGTKAEFDTACSNGDFAYSGGAFHDGFSDFVANEHIDWTAASQNFYTTGSGRFDNGIGVNTAPSYPFHAILSASDDNGMTIDGQTNPSTSTTSTTNLFNMTRDFSQPTRTTSGIVVHTIYNTDVNIDEDIDVSGSFLIPGTTVYGSNTLIEDRSNYEIDATHVLSKIEVAIYGVNAKVASIDGQVNISGGDGKVTYQLFGGNYWSDLYLEDYATTPDAKLYESIGGKFTATSKVDVYALEGATDPVINVYGGYFSASDNAGNANICAAGYFTTNGLGTKYGVYIDLDDDSDIAIYSIKGDWKMGGDNFKFYQGAEQDTSIYFDGSDLIINSENVTANDEIHFTNFDAYRFDNSVEIDGDLNHDGSNVGFYSTAPTSQATGYTTFSNLNADRTCDADSTTVDELADILGTLIEDLKSTGLIAA